MAEPVTPLIQTLSQSYLQCNAYIEQGADVDVDAFLEWLAEHKDGSCGEWLIEKDRDGSTPLHLALQNGIESGKLLPTIILAILDACPAAVQEPDNSAYSPLLVAFDRLGRFFTEEHRPRTEGELDDTHRGMLLATFSDRTHVALLKFGNP